MKTKNKSRFAIVYEELISMGVNFPKGNEIKYFKNSENKKALA